MGFDKQDSIGNSKGKKVDMNLKKRMENRNEFNSILKYDYGMPNQGYTEKINSYKPEQRMF